MAEDVYAVPDLTKKVRYRREREQETEDRGEREERVVDIYVSADDLGRGPDPDPDPDPGPGTQQNAAQAQHGASDESKKKNAFKAATVCLGVLCVILLAGIIGLAKKNSELNNQVQSRCNNLTAEHCGLRWPLFGSGYYISTEKKTWEQSRQYCRDIGADLIIINSKEEQDFVNGIVNKKDPNVWLGLIRRKEEGEWKWVDGTPLTSPIYYWRSGEPSNTGGGEDCAVHHKAISFRNGVGVVTPGWNDIPCDKPMRWMCERAL